MTKLTDHGFLSKQLTEPVEFTEEFVDKLASQFKLQGKEKALTAGLNSAAGWYATMQDVMPPKTSEQRARIERVNALASELDTIFGEASSYELRLILECAPDGAMYKLNDTILAVHQLKHSSAKALKAIPKKPGPPTKYAQSVLIAKLHETFIELKEGKPYNKYNFIQQCLGFLGIVIGRETIKSTVSAVEESIKFKKGE